MEKQSKADKKTKLREWRESNRLAARNLFPLPDSKLELFFILVEECLANTPCNHDHAVCRNVMQKMDLQQDTIETVISWCEDNSGYCDCEVILNTVGRWEESRERI
jgi:Fe2+ or Zn2+ uptake regulation protein